MKRAIFKMRVNGEQRFMGVEWRGRYSMQEMIRHLKTQYDGVKLVALDDISMYTEQEVMEERNLLRHDPRRIPTYPVVNRQGKTVRVTIPRD
jgi:hypothetical protein